MKRFFLASFIIFLFFTPSAFSQIQEGETEQTHITEFASQVSTFITLGGIFTLNNEGGTKSAVSPITFSTAIGAVWPNNSLLSFQPRLSFFTMYYIWNGKEALPSEVENRTALSLSFLLDIPAVFSFRVNKNTFETGLGLALLARIGILAPGVKGSETGASGSASSDVEKINEWFWSAGRFLYPELIFSWDYKISERLRAGLDLRWYIPLGALCTGHGLDTTMFALATKLIF